MYLIAIESHDHYIITVNILTFVTSNSIFERLLVLGLNNLHEYTDLSFVDADPYKS